MTEPKAVLEEVLRSAGLTDPAAIKSFWEDSVSDTATLTRLFDQYSVELPLNPQVVFYEAMSGSRMGDNPYAIFEYLRAHPEYGKFLHVWSFDQHSTIPEKYRGLDDVVFARKGSAAFSLLLAIAEHVICNANLPSFFAPRTGQKYLNTWHGIPYKALGRDSPKARFGAPSSTASFLKATHVLTTCEFMTNSMKSAYSMSGTSNALIAETGYPRVDITVKSDSTRMHEIRASIGIEEVLNAEPKPVVLYAPTWRSEAGEDVVDSDQLVRDLEALTTLDIIVLYRGHHRMDRIIRDQMVGNKLSGIWIPTHDISSNELLTIVDVLITDYSSIYFDFLPTGRPIVQYLYDYDEYKRTRGLNLEVNELPGSVAYTTAEFVSAVQIAADLVRKADTESNWSTHPLQGGRYAVAQQRFSPHEDGNASKRAVDFFFREDTTNFPVCSARDERPTIAFWGGCPDADTPKDEFFSVVIASAKSKGEQTTLLSNRAAFMPKSLVKDLKSFRTRLSTVSYTPVAPALQASEKDTYSSFIARDDLTADQIKLLVRDNPVLHTIFEREYRRRLGRISFDKVVLADGLSNHEIALATFAGDCQALSEYVRDQHAIAAGKQAEQRTIALEKRIADLEKAVDKLQRALPIRLWNKVRGRK